MRATNLQERLALVLIVHPVELSELVANTQLFARPLDEVASGRSRAPDLDRHCFR